MKPKNKLYLNAPKGVRVKRHTVGDDIRFTVRESDTFARLVALIRNNKFLWVKKGFSA